ncbi:MAG: hypothetical protein HC810_00740, partial [Acaryochloridaceae cyanobacterium RL_2_7]|nr:hypothetical protein [Acaryochloridaceae cyanobacterium RL_2_7]
MTQGVLWPEPDSVDPSVWIEFDDVQRALARLDVPLNVLMQALQEGRASLNSRTLYDAPTAPGYYQWNECVRSLSEQLVPQGWLRTNDANQPLLTHPQRRLVMIVNSGNRYVGDPETPPTTKCPKKHNHRQVIRSNNRQLDLFPCPVWFLLYSAESGELRSELSLPMGLTTLTAKSSTIAGDSLVTQRLFCFIAVALRTLMALPVLHSLH